jgi:Protein of unknown function (DUF2793)
MTKTPHLAISMLVPNQAQKEITLNEALFLIDVLLVGAAKDMALNAPPIDPLPGDLYLIGENPTDLWFGKANYLAYFFQGWRYLKPSDGMGIFVLSHKTLYRFINNHWEKNI